MNNSRRQFVRHGSFAALALAMAARVPAAFAQSGENLRIGALNDVTGAGSPYGGGMQKAILMAADEINATGGAGGRRIEVFAEDSQTAPDAGVLAAKKLIEVNKVHAILGTWSSGVAAAVMPLTDAAGIIHCTNAGASNITSSKGLMFRYSALSVRIGQALAREIAKRGHMRLATMAFNNPSGREITGGAKQGWEKLGRQLVGEVVYEPNRPSYRSEVQTILANNPDAIVLGGYLPDFTVILRETRQAGSNVKFYAPAWAVNQKLIDALGAPACEGVMTHDYVAALDSTAYKTFVDKFKKATGIDPTENYYACCAYDMMTVVGLAAQAAGGKPAIAPMMRAVANPPGTMMYDFVSGKKALAAGTKINYEGASGPIDFDDLGNVKPLFKLSEVRNGKVELVGNAFQDY
ncbi:MAG TPA: ABC transporter substrate-binding protein [Casimicrobiaceae bacterium]|nr:ABC transporter substrate-binding protein [Casimicrobiaceae bacterium]